MAQYMCGPCGWIYDEELGDPEHGIAPGTKFEDIPDDWKCPECGVGKEDFYLLDFVIAAAAPLGKSLGVFRR
ncbi:TPA: rubredoxin [Neisseria gonorrhoeae]